MSEAKVYRPQQTKDPRAAQVLQFWFGDEAVYGSVRTEWFKKDAAFDERIRAQFLPLLEAAQRGECAAWGDALADALALLIVLDQFSRNLYRGDARAFAGDPAALALANALVARGDDTKLLPLERMFVYLPFEHSEVLADQHRCVELMGTLGKFEETKDMQQWAIKHRDVILRFGRFPHRNAALGRRNTPEEAEYLAQPGAGF